RETGGPHSETEIRHGVERPRGTDFAAVQGRGRAAVTGAGRGHAAGTGIGRGRAVAVRGRTGGETDVLVVGGGGIGLSCALACRWRGLGVTLLEKGVTGGQASGAAAGLLAPFSERSEERRGGEGARVRVAGG